jgi:hypothetical protein
MRKTSSFDHEQTTPNRPYDQIVIEGARRRDDEPTQKIDLESSQLTSDDKLIAGYLIMEEHGMFAPLTTQEQQMAAENLRR